MDQETARRDTEHDIIGNAPIREAGGSALTPLSPGVPPSQQQPWVPDTAMGARLLCGVTLCLLGAGESGHSADVSEMSLPS